MAADFTLGGYQVNFYEHPRFQDAPSSMVAIQKPFKAVLETGMLEIFDEGTGRQEKARIHRVTTDIKEAMT